MNYQEHITNTDLNFQLLTGLKKHLHIAQNTSEPKTKRIQSLCNMQEVIEYVLQDMNQAIPPEETAICEQFFMLLLTKLKKAELSIHSKPLSFDEEIGFISTLLRIKS